METRVKVLRGKLIEAIRERRKEAIAEHAEAKAAYPAAEKKWREGMVKALSDILAKARTDPQSVLDNYYGDLRGVKLPARPSKVAAKANTEHYDRSIATLSMSAEETITITADD